MWDSLSCLLTLLESFDKNNPEMGIDSAKETDASKEGAALLSQHSQATGQGGGGSHTQRHVNSANGGGFESNHVSDTAQALVGKVISELTAQKNAELKCIINKDHQVTVAPKRMPLGARLAVNTYDDDCFYYRSWRNNVVIAFGTLSSFLT